MDHPSLQAVNPLISRVRIPGQTFPLPSGGLFYTNGELAGDVQNGEVHVYPMTAIDEVAMKSVDKVFSGHAVKEVFARCIPHVRNVGALSAKDVDYLLVALRKVSYGPEFEVNFEHDCEDAKEHVYKATLDSFLQRTKSVNPVTLRESFTFTLPNGQQVNYKPASYDDIVKLYQTQHTDLQNPSEPSDEVQLERILTSVGMLIQGVDEITDMRMIQDWLRSLPILWLRDIANAAQDTTSWGVNFELELVCKDCGATVQVPTPMNPISLFI